MKGLIVLLFGILLSTQVIAEDEAKPKEPAGSEKIVSKKAAPEPQKKLKPFTAVVLTGLGDLYIKQTNEEGVTVEADEAVIPLLSIKVSDKTLYLDFKQASKYTKAKIKYNLNIKQLNKLVTNSPGTVYIKDLLKTDFLDLSVDGFGEAYIKINTQKLNTKIGGGGKVVATGIALQQELTINGAGEFNGAKLSGKNGIVQMSGSAIAKTNVADTLEVGASEDALIKYCGKPKVKKQLTGSAMVMAISKSDCK